MEIFTFAVHSTSEAEYLAYRATRENGEAIIQIPVAFGLTPWQAIARVCNESERLQYEKSLEAAAEKPEESG